MTMTFSLSAKEVAQPVFDNREWVEGSILKDQDDVRKIYVLKGETVKNWSEIVDIQFLSGLQNKITLNEFEELNKSALLKICPDANWKTLSSNDNERTWEWIIKDCAKEVDQSSITKVVKTNEGFHLFHYATKKSNISDEVRETWLKNLNAIKIESE
jgi:hypothetical protein